jgi:threonine/homoserine/homoserine lactone efflux protein
MFEVLPSAPVLLAFLAAALVLAITPGPGVVYIVARTLTQGRGAGLASVAGVALGNFGNATAASLGLAALLAASTTAFAVVKYAGAAYLCYLGVRALRSPPAVQDAPPMPADRCRVWREGLVVALLNPKTTLFFAAFLPQFMQPAASAVGQAVVLSTLFVGIAAVSDACYVLLAGAIAPMLRGRAAAARRGRYVAAAVYFSLGLYAARP